MGYMQGKGRPHGNLLAGFNTCQAVAGGQGQNCAARTHHPALSMGLLHCPTDLQLFLNSKL